MTKKIELIDRVEKLNSKLNIMHEAMKDDMRIDSIYKSMMQDTIQYLEKEIINYDENYNAYFVI